MKNDFLRLTQYETDSGGFWHGLSKKKKKPKIKLFSSTTAVDRKLCSEIVTVIILIAQ